MQRFSTATFSTAEPLASIDRADCRRSIGVRVSGVFDHHGFTPPRRVVEIERETITINTATYARLAVPAEDWKMEAKDCIRLVIADLDAVIAELYAHKARLEDSLFDPEIH